MFKVKDSASENLNLLETVKSIFEKAEVNTQGKEITQVRRLGKVEGNRPILISFTNQKCKSEIFQKAKNFGKLNLGFANDMTKELREKKKIHYDKLREIKITLEQLGKIAVIKGSKILMEDKFYNIEEISEIVRLSQSETGKNEENYNGDSDESTSSRTSNASRKKGRPLGSKNLLLNKKQKSLKSEKKLAEFFQSSVTKKQPENSK